VTDSNLQSQDPTVAGRYLADQLSAEEQVAYEALLLSNPEALQELEATARLKVGLARLHDRGELDGLIRTPASARPLLQLRHPTFIALAASLALAVVGAMLWQHTMPRTDMLYASLSALQARGEAPRYLVAHYTLMRMRSANTEVLLSPMPTKQAFELRVMPELAPGAKGYLVQLFRVRADGTVERQAVATSLAMQSGADAFVTLYGNSDLLKIGRYQLKVSAAGASGATAAPELFPFTVASPLDMGGRLTEDLGSTPG
jgi:hypothetical protein